MAARLTTLVVLVIVSATLIAGLIVGAQRDDSEGPVDLIVHNAVIYTADEGATMAEAAAIRGNQILKVGSDREITRLRRPQTIVIDAGGAAVLPGFNDAQVELMQAGAMLAGIDLRDATTIEEVEARIRDWVDGNPQQPWVLGRGWRAEIFADGQPGRGLLDRLVPDRPAQILSADARSSWVNSKALQAAKIGKRTADPSQGRIVRELRTGEATGVLHGTAVELVNRLVPRMSEDERRDALAAAISEAHRVGVTSLQDVSGTEDDFRLYAEARRTGDLQIRIYSALPVATDLSDQELNALDAAIAKSPDDPLFKAGAISVVVDTSEGPAAAGAQPGPAGDAGAGLRFEPDPLNRLVRRLDARGWQVLAAASTERGVALSLNAFEHAVRSNQGRGRERRHRIQNAALVSADDLQRLGRLGVLASLRSPALADPLAETPTVPVQALALALRTVKGRLAFGSGWPVVPLDPLEGLRAALKPVMSDDGSENARPSLKALIDGYTSAAAWASFDEQRKGAIAPGMLADLVVLSEDIFKAGGAGLATARVETTIFDGKVVYQRARRATN